MNSMRPDPSAATVGPDRPAYPVDARLVDALRAALLAVAHEQPPAQDSAAPPEKPESRRPAWRGQLTQLIGAILVFAVAVLALRTYLRIGEEQGRNRSEVGKMRTDVGKFRPQLLRKDEFTSRDLAIRALAYEVEANHHEEMKGWQESVTDLNQTLQQVRQQTRELKDETRRAADRLDKLEQRLNGRQQPGPEVRWDRRWWRSPSPGGSSGGER